jgi:Sec-independent protein translocase protein TatA
MVVMLVLLVLFGSKDAPRILRKINEIINQIRNTAEGFKREVLYSDLAQHAHSTENDVYDPYDENCSIVDEEGSDTTEPGEVPQQADEEAVTRDNEDGDAPKT